MHITSAAFTDGRPIPRRHTCDGGDVSPPLKWSGAPETARSFALLCDDPDAPGGTWRHWAVYDIPATQQELTEGLAPRARGVLQGVNDFRKRGYGGPCPPHGHGPHRYRFTLLALDADTLGLADGAAWETVARAARARAIAEASLTGIYER